MALGAAVRWLTERAPHRESAPKRRGKAPLPTPPPPLLAKVLDTTGRPATSSVQDPVAAAAASLPARSPWKRWKKSYKIPNVIKSFIQNLSGSVSMRS